MYQGTITRTMQFTKSSIYEKLLTKADILNRIGRLKAAKPSQAPSICAEICEMFRALGIPCEENQSSDYYHALADKTELPDFSDIEERILKIMYENFGNYPTPEDYMRRMVDRLCNPDDGWQKDPLRLRILKQCIKYGNCLTYSADGKKVNLYGGEGYLKKYVKARSGKAVKSTADLLAYVDDGVFDVLPTATKAQKKFDGTYGLLKLADDLAHGVFKAGCATRRDLYMFAVVFDMTYCVSPHAGAMETTELFDYASDIEKNLFTDYYANNLMRFITETYEGDQSAFEQDPSGQGINYKNFAEMVYIYFISRNYEPAEKLRRAAMMIERLKTSARPSPELPEDGATRYYTTLFTEQILKMDESAFEAFVAEHYDCDVEFEDTDKTGRSYTGKRMPLQLQTAQQTAFRLYQALIAEMESATPALLRENCNYGLWFVDVSAFRKFGTEQLRAMLGHPDEPEKLDSFVKLLYGINLFLGSLFVEEKSSAAEAQQHSAVSKRLIRKMDVRKPEDMTRTALVVAYYYWYNQRQEQNNSQKSFVEVMDDYTDSVSGLNQRLEAAGYQPVSDRNIFDLAVIFSSYAYLAV